MMCPLTPLGIKVTAAESSRAFLDDNRLGQMANKLFITVSMKLRSPSHPSDGYIAVGANEIR
jgi:hypothetical protein